MKKAGALFFACALACGMAVPAFAASPDKEARQAARQAYREAIAADKQVLQENREALKALGTENKTLSAAWKAFRKENKNAETPLLSDEEMAQIEALLVQLKEDRSTLKGTSGELKTLLAAKKEQQKAQAYDDAAASLKQALSIQTLKLEQKQSVNDLLEQLNEAIQ